MRRQNRFVILATAVVLLGWGVPGMLHAQSMGNMGMPNMGALSGASAPAAKTNPEVPSLGINDTFVSFIDSAVPRNVVGLRFDADYANRQPMRATYLFNKGGVPNAVGFPLPETRVDSLAFTSFAEYSIESWFSVFIEAPYRWINPEVNRNEHGTGDMRYGLKICTWSDEAFIATILLRIYEPSAGQSTMGTGHWSIEPGLLAAYRISPMLHLEGELRYWMPLGGNDFSGNILRYGLGLSYGQRSPSGVWYMPVLEGIGWTTLGGKTMVASSVDNFVIQDAGNQTIVNGYLGLRVGYGQNADLFIGYGRSFTGQAWAREMYRFEFRFSF